MIRRTAKRGLTAVPTMACRGLKTLGEIKLRKENNEYLGRCHQNPSKKGHLVNRNCRCTNDASHSVSVNAWMEEVCARSSATSLKNPAYLLI